MNFERKVTVVFDKNDLDIIAEKVKTIISLISEYGCNNSPDISCLKLIVRNIEIYNQCNTGFDELRRYMIEDYNNAMRKLNIRDSYLPITDIELKAKCNKILDECFGLLDRMFDTYWIGNRKWYTKQELIDIGIKFSNGKMFYDLLSKLAGNTIKNSPISGISDEVWTYAKCLCVADSDEELIKWFYSDIPAFGYISLIHMSSLENGDAIMKYFLTMIPIN